jgi:hypothetical protein
VYFISGVVTSGATTEQQTAGHITTVLHTGEDRQIAMAAIAHFPMYAARYLGR